MQHTISEKISCVGTGLHTGRTIELEILPAPINNGITFERTDIENFKSIKASYVNVSHTELATTLQDGGQSISTIEHLMAALMGLGIDNARILVNGPEVPIMDGSAAPFVYMLQDLVQPQKATKKFAIIHKTVTVRDGDKYATVTPARQMSIKYGISFPHPLIGEQNIELNFSAETFVKELSRARTFGFLKDVEYLKSRGLALGGGLDNAVVIDNYTILNPNGLRFPDEFVRHKTLDAIGDFSLLGMPIIGKIEVFKGGHALHSALLRALVEEKAFHVQEEHDSRHPTAAQEEHLLLPAMNLA